VEEEEEEEEEEQGSRGDTGRGRYCKGTEYWLYRHAIYTFSPCPSLALRPNTTSVVSVVASSP
jgi:hypothetical protein